MQRSDSYDDDLVKDQNHRERVAKEYEHSDARRIDPRLQKFNFEPQVRQLHTALYDHFKCD